MKKEIDLRKRVYAFMILAVLRRYSDGAGKDEKIHFDDVKNKKRKRPLTQQEIMELVKKEYGVNINKGIMKETLIGMRDFLYETDFGFTLEYNEINRTNKYTEKETKILRFYREEVLLSDVYLVRDITDAEMHMLIDGLLFSKYIPYSQCKDLVKNIENLAGNSYLRKNDLPDTQPVNKQLTLAIEIIKEAIAKNRQVSFNFMYYTFEKKQQAVSNKDGSPRQYKVTPYHIVITNSRYYLICTHEDSNEFYHYRLDYIRDAKLLEDTPGRSDTDIIGDGKRFNLSKHMAEHIYMYGGKSVMATFRCDKRVTKQIIGHIIDWFGHGDNVRFINESENFVITTMTANEKALVYWALQYGACVEVLEPDFLRKKVRENVENMWVKYQPTNPSEVDV
jgi:predicted DNA-binding transcriptional regulator YafY